MFRIRRSLQALLPLGWSVRFWNSARSPTTGSRRSQACLLREFQSKSPNSVPSHVPDAVRTCRPPCQHEVGTDLPLERLAMLGLHRQCTLWSNVALSRKIKPPGLGKTAANAQISVLEPRIGTPGARAP